MIALLSGITCCCFSKEELEIYRKVLKEKA
jgi:hypothetical protein